MAAQNFRVIFTESAWEDIGELVRYWADRDEPERGEQHAYDLPTEAIRQLSDPDTACGGRHLRNTAYPETQELPDSAAPCINDVHDEYSFLEPHVGRDRDKLRISRRSLTS